MLKFGLSQKLSSLFFISIIVSILLSLNLPAAEAVNSPTMTILDLEEMSQIAGGSTDCYDRGRTGGGNSGSCRAGGSFCLLPSQCGTNPYMYIFGQQYCKRANRGHYDCSCSTVSPAWKMWDCHICTNDFECTRAFLGQGGSRIECTLSTLCP